MWNPFKPRSRGRIISIPMKKVMFTFLMDSQLPHFARHLADFDIEPMSEDVMEMEKETSEDRLDKVALYLPLIEHTASAAAHIVITEQMRLLKETYPDNEDIHERIDSMSEELEKLLNSLVIRTSAANLSTLFDLGLVAASDPTKRKGKK
jgi:hypothetical protein